MEVREAVRIAKEQLQKAFLDESIVNLGLEEVEFDDQDDVWNITLGFSRPWNKVPKGLSAFLPNMDVLTEPMTRDYKVVQIRDSDQKVIAIRLREIAA